MLWLSLRSEGMMGRMDGVVFDGIFAYMGDIFVYVQIPP